MSEPRKTSRRFRASVWTGDPRSPELREPWQKLFLAQKTPGAVYQSPGFYDLLAEGGADSRPEIVTVSDKAGAIVGVVPVQKAVVELPFSLGDRTLANPRLKSLKLLGSEPMVPPDPDALDSLFLLMAEHYPQSQATEMDAVPQDGGLWKYLQASDAIRKSCDLHVLHGFRDCHSVDIPKSTEDYYHRLTKKRRYNLLRQEKLLHEHVGAALELHVIEKEGDLGELFAALDFLGAAEDEDAVDMDYEGLARYGFLCCFVLKAGEHIIGLTLGTKSKDILRIHRFYYDRALERYSPGTTLWQFVLRHLIRKGAFVSVDMGYGTPAYRYRATNIIKQRGKVLLFRRSVANRWRILAHSSYSSAVNLVKGKLDLSHGD